MLAKSKSRDRIDAAIGLCLAVHQAQVVSTTKSILSF